MTPDQALLAELQAIRAIAETVSQSSTLDEILIQALGTVLEITGQKTGSVFLVESKTQQLSLRAHVGLSSQEVAQSVDIDEAFCGPTVHPDQVMVADRSCGDICPDTKPGSEHDHILIPLKSKGEVRGIMSLCLGAPRELSEVDSHLLAVIGDQIGVAVENARLLAETRRRASEFETLSRLARVVGQTLALEESLSCSLADILEALGARAGGAFVLDPTALTVRLVAWHGLYSEWCERSQQVNVGEGLFGGIAERGEPLLAATPNQMPPALRDAGPGEALAAVPLRSKGKVLGIMFVLAEQADTLDVFAFQFLTMLGEQIGVAIENARLLNMLKHQQAKLLRRHRQMIALNLVAKTVNQILDLDEIMTSALDKALDVMDMETGWIRLLDEKGLLRLGPYQGLSRELIEGLAPLLLGEGIAGQVTESGQPIVVTDVTEDPRLASRAIAEAGLRTFMSLPLRSQGRVVGVMNLASYREHLITQEQLMLALAISDQIGVAVEKARLFQALERSRREWEATFSALQDGIAIVDRQFRIVRVNRTLAAMFGTEPEEMVGQLCCQVFYGNPEQEQSWCYCRQILNTRQTMSVETDQLQAPGTYDVRLFPLFNTDDELVGVIHSFRNITETRALRDLMAQNEKLIALGRLAASVAHEVNNPLFSIGNCLTLLEGAIPPDNPNQTFVHLAQSELHRLGQTVERMLDFARPAHEPREAVDVNQLLSNALLMTERHMDYSKVTARPDLIPDLPPLLASGNQLTQVFINLILNAIEAMPDGGELRVCSRLIQEGERPFIEIEIADTGLGILPEHMDRIFEPFFSTKHEVKGVGLGLAISYGIVQGHKGTINVSSKVGGGTTFTIRLPILSKEEWKEWERAAEAS